MVQLGRVVQQRHPLFLFRVELTSHVIDRRRKAFVILDFISECVIGLLLFNVGSHERSDEIGGSLF